MAAIVVTTVLTLLLYVPTANAQTSPSASASAPTVTLSRAMLNPNFQGTYAGSPIITARKANTAPTSLPPQHSAPSVATVVTAPHYADQSRWVPINPGSMIEQTPTGSRLDSGRVTSIAVSEFQGKKVVYIGSAGGGVWSSVNDGSSWAPLSDSQMSLTIGSVAIDPTNSNILYAGTGEQNLSNDSRYGHGLLKSTDGGKTWTLLGADWFDGIHISKVVVDPFNSSNVWVACDYGLFQSPDGGDTWNWMWSPGLGFSPEPQIPTDLYIDKKTPGVLYMSVLGSGLYKSTDGGEDFELLGDDGSLPNFALFVPNFFMLGDSLAVVEGGSADSDTVYTNYSNLFGNSMGFFVSHDGGTSWRGLRNVPPYFDGDFSFFGVFNPQDALGYGWYDNVIAVDPTNPNHIIAGGLTAAESRDGGQTWKVLDFFSLPSKVNLHPSIHTITFDTHGNAYLGTDGGVFEETAKGIWRNLNTNLATGLFSPGLSVGGNGSIVLVGSPTNGTFRTNGTTNWAELIGGDGGYTWIDPNNSRILFAESQWGNLERSTDGGKTWVSAKPNYALPNISPDVPFVVKSIGSTTQHQVLVGSDRLYLSRDDGKSYRTVSPFWVGAGGIVPITSIAQSPTNPNVIYIGLASGDVFVTSDLGGVGGMDWRHIYPVPGGDFTLAPEPYAEVTSISINPANDKEVTVTYGNPGFDTPAYWFGHNNHVFWTHDASVNTPVWSDVSDNSNLPNTWVYASAYFAGSILIGTEQGVYLAQPGSTDWQLVGTGLPNSPVTSIVPVGTRQLFVGTYGRGAFTITLGN